MAYGDLPQGVAKRKSRNLRTLNNQHFHSPLCILWITEERSSSMRTGSFPSNLERFGEHEHSRSHGSAGAPRGSGDGDGQAEPPSSYLT
jgi:hypothetical protein